jgi:hypothetical protein
MTMRDKDWTALLAVAALLCLAVPAAAVLAPAGAARGLPTAAAFALVPGCALLALLTPLQAPSIGVVAVVSLSLSALFAQGMLWTGWWYPTEALIALCVVGLGPIAHALALQRRAAAAGPDSSTSSLERSLPA